MKKIVMIVYAMVAPLIGMGDEPKPCGGPYTETVDGIEWRFRVNSDLKACVGILTGGTAIPESTIGNITIPATLGGRTVVSVDHQSFYGCAGLTGVAIPSSVTHIGEWAFMYCTGLTKIEIPANVTNIGWAAFSQCSGLKNLSIPSRVTEIGKSAFAGCRGITNVVISKGVKTIEERAFSNCNNLRALSIPSSVTRIENEAFTDCGGLGDGVVIIDGCVLTVNGKCPNHVVIPEGVRLISGGAISQSNVERISIPSSVTIIVERAFAQCNNLTDIVVAKNNLCYKTVDGIVFSGDGERLVCFPPARTGTYIIPQEVSDIGNYAFYRCVGLANVVASQNVTNIGAGAFYLCSGLTNFDIPLGVRRIGSNSFRECTALMSVFVPSGAVSIGENAFCFCGSLTNACISSSVKDIGRQAFYHCASLKSVTIFEGVDNVGDYAFAGCGMLNNIRIPSSVTAVGDGVFSECRGLTNIIFSGISKLKSIGSFTFSECYALSDITIPSQVAKAGGIAFNRCTNLTTVTFLDGVSSVGNQAFVNCDKLCQVDFKGPPPNDLLNAFIKKNALIRYNSIYESEWLSAIRYCGFTNVKPCVFGPENVTISPANSTMFDTSLTVSMACATGRATIHYTTNGTTPTIESPVYQKKFRIYGKTTVKAIAVYEDGTPSEMTVAEYAKGRCDNPVITPADGTIFHGEGQRVSIAWEETNGVLRVTTDGSEPTEESPEYEGPFTIDETTTVKAKVFGDAWFDSQVVTATLTREWVKLATPEIAADETFTGTKNKVVISCANEGATIYYTLDGSEPTTSSLVYEKPFCVGDSCTIRAKAVRYDYVDSDVAEKEIAREWGIGQTMGKPDRSFETGGDEGFMRVVDETAALGESMKSGEIKNSQTSILSTVVVGPGTLTFKWKTSCEYDEELHEWDHAEFVVDGDILKVLDGVTDWKSVSCDITGDGPHAVIWRYVKDESESGGEDCLWVSEYAWASDLNETQTTSVPVPYDWLTKKCSDVVDEYDSYEKVGKQKALNKRLTVEQCYVAGLDPESATNEFTATIGPDLNIGWKPDLKTERNYKVWGSTNLVNGGDWEYPTNALHRFFKVTVEMP